MIDDPLNRLSVLRGEDLPQSKLDEYKVRKARSDYERARLVVQRIQARYSVKGIANRYGVHHRTMEKALSGETWSHIP
jgi:hypothetical protein